MGGPALEPWQPVAAQTLHFFEILDDGQRPHTAEAGADGPQAARVIAEPGESGAPGEAVAEEPGEFFIEIFGDFTEVPVLAVRCDPRADFREDFQDFIEAFADDYGGFEPTSPRLLGQSTEFVGRTGNFPPPAPSAASRMRSSSEVPPVPRRGSSTFAISPRGNFFFR